MLRTNLSLSRFELWRAAPHPGTGAVDAVGLCPEFLDYYLASAGHQLPAALVSIRLARGLVRLPGSTSALLNGPVRSFV
jgi:hypothetical protein